MFVLSCQSDIQQHITRSSGTFKLHVGTKQYYTIYYMQIRNIAPVVALIPAAKITASVAQWYRV